MKSSDGLLMAACYVVGALAVATAITGFVSILIAIGAIMQESATGSTPLAEPTEFGLAAVMLMLVGACVAMIGLMVIDFIENA